MIVEMFSQDLGYICEACEGANFDIDFVDTISNPKLEKEPNTCHRCWKTYQKSENIPFGMVYIRAKNGEKYSPLEVTMIKDMPNLNKKTGRKKFQNANNNSLRLEKKN